MRENLPPVATNSFETRNAGDSIRNHRVIRRRYPYLMDIRVVEAAPIVYDSPHLTSGVSVGYGCEPHSSFPAQKGQCGNLSAVPGASYRYQAGGVDTTLTHNAAQRLMHSRAL